MPRGSDDALARSAILKVIEAVRAAMTDTSAALELLADAEMIAVRIDAKRGTAKTSESGDQTGATP